ncbi:preprotein translocase subunit SecG [Limihaloglobus sulfuriphilus]|uniref:Protein-export membrane protein SecG n=1 Tax=Limihaloglobus sulfuriphilus TaxID=1851148 RepID=A0A1Q2MBV5_9BACT|nr:preprotein translocase subunit SecG [Limihaloglobus sulfuriphilus]AQQ70154.1 preprotein translocase subunit SecG [Limihaloglobus sulfuriphilus]
MLLANLSIFWTLVGILWLVISVVLALIILIQKGRGGGLSGAFGGIGAGVLGTKTGDFLTWITVIFVAMFLLLGIGLAKFYKPKGIEELKSVVVEDATGAAGLGEEAAETAGETGEEAAEASETAQNAAEAASGQADAGVDEAQEAAESAEKAAEAQTE